MPAHTHGGLGTTIHTFWCGKEGPAIARLKASLPARWLPRAHAHRENFLTARKKAQKHTCTAYRRTHTASPTDSGWSARADKSLQWLLASKPCSQLRGSCLNTPKTIRRFKGQKNRWKLRGVAINQPWKFIIVHNDTLIHINYYCGCVFCSILRLCILAFAYFFTSKVHRGSAVKFGQALPGFLITAHHLYASLIELLAVWRHNKPKTKNQSDRALSPPNHPPALGGTHWKSGEDVLTGGGRGEVFIAKWNPLGEAWT